VVEQPVRQIGEKILGGHRGRIHVDLSSDVALGGLDAHDHYVACGVADGWPS